MVTACIEQHVDVNALSVVRTVEAEERAQLARLINHEFSL
jgi:hypothetical protein